MSTENINKIYELDCILHCFK